ncbi:MAG: LicD family protein [Bacteroidales bacterium]|nr:LicD family protein [Bacteroidales bacterium]
MNGDLSEHQSMLLKVLKEFDRFCSENHIQYYAWCGTLIGAIRHGGFIPWDDDIDVAMRREDYDRFIHLRDHVRAGFKIACYHDGESPYPFAKFYSTRGTIWEYPQFPFIIGPWIDIFPLDNCRDGVKNKKALEAFHSAMWKYRKSIANSTWKDIGSDLRHGEFVPSLFKIVKKIRYVPFKRRYICLAEAVEESIRSLKGDEVGDYSVPLENEVFPKSWFEKCVRVPFENYSITVPGEFDKILSYMYGDYMKLPPEHKRQRHGFYFIDLRQSLGKEEIMSKYSSLLAKESHLSLHTIIDELKHRSKVWKVSRK